MPADASPYQLASGSAAWLDTPLIRRAGREVLSLALMDARNHTLQLASHIERGLELLPAADPQSARGQALWLLGEVAWFQERWIARNLQRHLGLRCDPQAARLASILPQADAWWEDAPPAARAHLPLPQASELRAYLLQTLETTLALLEHAADDDQGLYFFRLCVLHEDLQAERMVELAQTLQLPLERPLVQAFAVPAVAQREPLWLPACTWLLGSVSSAYMADQPSVGFAFDNEQPQHGVPVPEFEIDAQPVSWSQFVEFVDDGGYDREELWSAAGWAWLQALAAGEGRRGPRHVEQIGVASGAVMQRRFGQAIRMSPLQPAMHLSWWEAQAWCCWAGRRLPLEVEWEMAAETASRRGFRWGDVWEWTASTFRPYPGFAPGPDAAYSQAGFDRAKVLRGGSAATRTRLKSARFRRFAEPASDQLFCGFRSCAL
jgi:ergothioneine biosynthesis protein EgtB